MSAKRNHYTSTPLMRMDRNPQSVIRDEPPVVLEQETVRVKRYRVLQSILIVLLPILFIVALIVKENTVRLAFIAAALFFLLLMWLIRAFAYNARAKLTLLYILACAVMVARIISANPGSLTERVGKVANPDSLFTSDSALDTPTLSQIGSEETVTEETQEPEATAAPMSAAQTRLEEFMTYWALGDQTAMLNMCTPSWIDKMDNPQASLWRAAGAGMNRPSSYIVERVDGSDTDSSRSIMIVANIDKSDGTVESRRYQILMQRANDVWYVDPVSLNSIGIVTADDPQPFEQISSIITDATPAPTPLPTVNPAMVLYYNPDGGSKYHTNAYCTSVNVKYQPLSGQITYADLDNPNYRTLKPCKQCQAPERAK